MCNLISRSKSANERYWRFCLLKERKVFYLEKIFHPVSGENGFFCTELEKELIDVALIEMLQDTTSSESGVRNG